MLEKIKAYASEASYAKWIGEEYAIKTLRRTYETTAHQPDELGI